MELCESPLLAPLRRLQCFYPTMTFFVGMSNIWIEIIIIEMIRFELTSTMILSNIPTLTFDRDSKL